MTSGKVCGRYHVVFQSGKTVEAWPAPATQGLAGLERVYRALDAPSLIPLYGFLAQEIEPCCRWEGVASSPDEASGVGPTARWRLTGSRAGRVSSALLTTSLLCELCGLVPRASAPWRARNRVSASQRAQVAAALAAVATWRLSSSVCHARAGPQSSRRSLISRAAMHGSAAGARGRPRVQKARVDGEGRGQSGRRRGTHAIVHCMRMPGARSPHGNQTTQRE